MQIFWRLMTKNLKGWSHKLETLHVETLGTILKNLENKTINWRQPFIVNFTLEIYNFVPKNFITWVKAKLFGFIFMGSGQLVPSIWFTFFPQSV